MAVQFAFDAIGTKWVIDIYDDVIASESAESLQAKILERIELFDRAYSRFRPDSLVTQMSRHTGIYQLPADALPLLDMYRRLYDITSGKMTPLIGTVLEQAGYDAKYSLKSRKLVQPLPWDDAIKITYPNIEILQPVMLDFGAAGKGYLVDIIAGILQQSNITGFCIDAGGDILHRNVQINVEPLQVALENPFNTTQAIGVANVFNQSICGSAGNRRVWGEYTHIINPETLNSATDIAAVWVVAQTALDADGVATALYFAEPHLLNTFSFEYLILYTNSSVKKSDGFPAELFYQ